MSFIECLTLLLLMGSICHLSYVSSCEHEGGKDAKEYKAVEKAKERLKRSVDKVTSIKEKTFKKVEVYKDNAEYIQTSSKFRYYMGSI